MDGGRRWQAARQLHWAEISCEIRPEWEAATIIVDSLLGQRSMSKGAKAYLVLGIMKDFVKAVERRRIQNLTKGQKNLQNPLFFPKSPEATSEGVQELCQRLGIGRDTYFRAAKIRKFFALDHVFEFQTGLLKTLKQHFEPLLLDPDNPMGLGEVLKGIGWFVDEDGNPKKQLPPPDRNSHLFYFSRAWEATARQWERWGKLSESQREQAFGAVNQSVLACPDDALEQIARAIKQETSRRKK